MKTAIQGAFLMLGALAVLTGCGGGISSYARSQVSYFGSFQELQRNPEPYRGQTVVWGGRVISATVLDGAVTEIEVLQLNLGRSQRPVGIDDSQGRFLIRSDTFLDPVLYPKGTLVTVVGPVQGTEDRLIDRMNYRYPVVGITELKKWPPGSGDSPRFHFGIGIGTHL